MSSYPYDHSFDPSAPVIEMTVRSPNAAATRLVQALLDTGADQTVIPEDTARELGLVRLDEVNVFGVSPDPVLARVYWVSARLVELSDLDIEVLSWPYQYALVGRDLLNRLRLILDGPQLQLTLEEP